MHVAIKRVGFERAAAMTACARRARGIRAAAEHDRPCCAIQFGNSHHDRAFNRHQAAVGRAPCLQRLELNGVSRDIGHVERGQCFLRRRRVVVGRAADEREAAQRHNGVDGGHAIALEKAIDGRPHVEPAGVGWNDVEAARFETGDDAVVVGSIARQDIRTHHEDADGAVPAVGGKCCDRVGDLAGKARMIHADIRIFDRCGRGESCAQRLARPIGVAADEKADHVADINIGTGEPVLKRQEVGAHVLRCSGNETQQLRETLQHRHLLGALAHWLLRILFPAQFLQKAERAFRRTIHCEFADTRQAHDFLGGRHADKRVAVRAACGQVFQDRRKVVFEKQHAGDDDVGSRDISLAARQCGRVGAPLGRRMKLQVDPRNFPFEARARPHERRGQMGIHGHNDNADGRGAPSAGPTAVNG